MFTYLLIPSLVCPLYLMVFFIVFFVYKHCNSNQINSFYWLHECIDCTYHKSVFFKWYQLYMCMIQNCEYILWLICFRLLIRWMWIATWKTKCVKWSINRFLFIYQFNCQYVMSRVYVGIQYVRQLQKNLLSRKRIPVRGWQRIHQKSTKFVLGDDKIPQGMNVTLCRGWSWALVFSLSLG